MLDLAKIESGTREWHTEAVDLREVVREAAAAHRPAVPRQGRALETASCPRACRRRSRPTATGCMQVLLNLLSNAVKFSPRDAGLRRRSRVAADAAASARRRRRQRRRASRPSDHEAIFEKFRQVGDTLTAKPQGTGLGLPISRMIVEQFGGELWVESAPGGGAIFRVWLPREPAAASA